MSLPALDRMTTSVNGPHNDELEIHNSDPACTEDRVFPLTRGQLDIWLAREAGRFAARWQLGYLMRIEGTVEPGLLERAIRLVVREAEPLRAAFFQVDGQVFQKVVDYPDVE
ncbi:MAG: hypothetical protein ACRDT5_07120, partial [Mycobacterium sp.]